MLILQVAIIVLNNLKNMGNSKIDSEALNYWRFLLKLVIPIILLSCKAKIEQDKIKVDTVVINKPDTTTYKWCDNFTDKQLRELCENGKLVINNK
jgi:hypothetical protein